MTTPPENKIEPAANNLTAEQLLQKLCSALKRDGDFPASAKVVTELRMLVSDPKTTANQIAEVILREPSLGTRVLHLVNSTFYRRAKPIMTVSQAIVQIGMRPLAELCAGLVLLQKFVPVARRGGSFAHCLQKTMVTSILAGSLTAESHSAKQGKSDESGFLAGSFSEIGTLLLAYYFPQVYDSAIKRAKSKNIEIGQGIREITGLAPAELSKAVMEALELPPLYRLIVAEDTNHSPQSLMNAGIDPAKFREIVQTVKSARSISSVLVHGKDRAELEAILGTVAKNTGLDIKKIQNSIGRLSDQLREQCSTLDLSLPPLPEYVSTLGTPSAALSAPVGDAAGNQFGKFVEEIRQAVDAREPTSSIITTVMETFAWSLKFDRVLLLLVASGKRRLQGRMLLGKIDNFSPREFERALGADAGPHAPDAKAFAEGRPVFFGDPLFEDGWPIAAIPIGFGSRAIGVIYADRVAPESDELSAQDQAAIGMLTELLDRSISSHS